MIKWGSGYSLKVLLLGKLFTWQKSIIIMMETFHTKSSTDLSYLILFNIDTV